MHPSFYLFGHQFFSYTIMTQIAALIGVLYLFFSLRGLRIKVLSIVVCLVLGFIVQYFGGMLIPFLYRWIYLHETPWWNVLENSPGRYFHSISLSVILFTFIWSNYVKWPTGKVMDHCAIALILGSSVGRIGCYLDGCCSGKLCDLPWAVAFPLHPESRVHPTQLYMLFLESALWIFLIYFNRHKKGYDGQTFWLSIFLYGIYRTCIEWLRTNPVFFWGLTHAQVFSMVTVILSGIVLLSHRNNGSRILQK